MATAKDPTGRRPHRRRRWVALPVVTAAAALAGGLAVASGVSSPGSTPAGGLGWQWYKTDTHVHSVFSSDAGPDLGIISRSGQLNHYSALFLTDHNQLSSFAPVSVQTANHLTMDDDANQAPGPTAARWTATSVGAPTAPANAQVSSPVDANATPAQSLHLAATSAAGVGEESLWSKRGPNFMSGDAIMTFALLPQTLTGGSSFYVSAALGGDPTISPPVGYTTTAGTVMPGTSFVFVWYWGSAPPASLWAGATPIMTALTPATCPAGTGGWLQCRIDLNTALAQVPANLAPLPYNAFTDVKLAALGNNGTADGYFDTVLVQASQPVSPQQEWAYRDQFLSNDPNVLGTWDTPSFRIYPSIEMGTHDHANRFNFGAGDASSYKSYLNGIQGIPDTQASGYPAQLDHPGLPGGVLDQEAIAGVTSGQAPACTCPAFGADTMEVRTQNMINDWDAILTGGHVLIGNWATDDHLGTWSAGSEATYIEAPSLAFNDLMRSMYEGRQYLATSAFAGRVIFTPDPASPDDYPARYPTFVSPSQTSASVHLAITDGIASSTVVWITNGAKVLATDPASGPSYDATKTIPISGPFTYVRAELRDASGVQKAMTEALVFTQVPGLPSGMSYHVDGVTTPTGTGYTNLQVLGITGGSWNAGAQTLSLTVANPAASLVEFEVAPGTAGVPTGVTMDGSALPRAASLAGFQAATGPAWFYDASAGQLHAKALQGSGQSTAVVSFGSSAAAGPPAPSGLTANATGSTSVQLSWAASAGAAGYTIFRNGAVLASVPAGTTSYTDTTVVGGSTYQYAVDAVDGGGVHSALSDAASATPRAPTTTTTTTTTTSAAPTSPPSGGLHAVVVPRAPTTTTTTTTTAAPTSAPPGGELHTVVAPTSPASIVNGAFAGVASQSHQEAYDLVATVTGTQLATENRTPRTRSILHIRAQGIVQDAAHSRTIAQGAGLPGKLRMVSYDGTTYVSLGRGAFRQATGPLSSLLPPVVPAELGQGAAGLVGLSDLGQVTVGGAAVEHYRAALSSDALRRYLAAALAVRGPASVRSMLAGGHPTLNLLDLWVTRDGGLLQRAVIDVKLNLAHRRGVLGVHTGVQLSDYGADLIVPRPRARGAATAFGQLIR